MGGTIMASPTKIIKKLPVDAKTLERFRKALFLQKVEEAVKGIEDTLAKLPSDAEMKEKIHASDNSVYMPEQHAYYRADIACLMPKYDVFYAKAFVHDRTYYERENPPQGSWQSRNISEGVSKTALQFASMEAQLPTTEEIQKFIPEQLKTVSSNYIYTKENTWYGVVCEDRDGFKIFDVYYGNTGDFLIRQWGDTNGHDMGIIPFIHLNGKNSKPVDGTKALWFWLKHEWSPEDGFFTDAEQAAYTKAMRLVKKYGSIIRVKDDAFVIDKQRVIDDLLAGKMYDFITFDVQAMLAMTELPADDMFLGAIKKAYLTCDKRRAALDPYDERLLTDPNRGHWDLWDKDETAEDSGGTADLGEGLVARDPAADINEGFVAIDFGTKSTVVVYESGPEMHMPLQVGSGTYSQGFDAKNYENPTIVHFLDIPAFEAAYRAREGRPETSWETMTVSHTAKGDLDSNTTTAWYASFFDQLKQWCGAKNQRVKIRDTAGHVLDLPTFM